MNRRPNSRIVKIHRSYTALEAAALLGIHENTFRGWFKRGLRRLDGNEPHLVLGCDLATFLRSRERRITLGPAEFYCLGCKAPRRAAPGTLVAAEQPSAAVRAEAVCSVCGSKISRHFSRSDFEELLADFERGEDSLMASPQARSKCETSAPILAPRRHNEENERLKHRYLAWQGEAGGLSDASLDVAAYALHLFEESTGRLSFRSFEKVQAIGFKRFLETRGNSNSGQPLNLVTIYGHISAVTTFFKWLAGQRGFRRVIAHDDIQYLRLAQKQVRAATSVIAKRSPTLVQVRSMVEAMPSQSIVERRDRAVVCLMMLTGARDGAVVSLRLKHVRLAEKRLVQDAREVTTKKSKSMDTNFFPVGDSFERHLADWLGELEQLGFGPNDSLFPATQLEQDKEHRLFAGGLTRSSWSTTGPIRALFRRASHQVGLEGLTPHSLRRTLMVEAYRRNLTAEDLKAWSQNLGHEHLATSLNSYGKLSADRQADIMLRMWKENGVERAGERGLLPGLDDPELLKAISTAIWEQLRKKNEELA